MTITECKYYRDKDKECDVWGIPCEMKDCYFKELKHLEQENEKLKEEKDKYYQQTLDDEIKLNELYQVLQEIKKECHWTSECGVTNDNMWGYERILDLITKAEEE